MPRLLVLLLAVSAAATAQPQLHRLTVSSDIESDQVPQFQVTEAPADLVLKIAASVSGGEVEGISISMSADDHFGGHSRLVVPTITTPEATVRYPLPRFLETGTYRLNVAVVGTDGLSRRWTPDELAEAGLPYQFEVIVVGDLEAPAVTSIEIPPIEDAAQPRGVARFTFRDRSGVLAYRVVVAAPSGRRYVLADHQSNVGVGPTHTFTVPFDLFTGPQLDGPAEEGYWSIAEVHTTDSNGFSQILTGRDLFNLEVQNRFAVGDVPPEVAAGPGCGAPNPVALGATVRVPASADVYDVRGRRVARAAEDGALSTDGLSRGIYLTRSATPGEPPCRFTVIGR